MRPAATGKYRPYIFYRLAVGRQNDRAGHRSFQHGFGKIVRSVDSVLSVSARRRDRADVSSRPYLLLRHRHIEQLSARKTCIAADTAVCDLCATAMSPVARYGARPQSAWLSLCGVLTPLFWLVVGSARPILGQGSRLRSEVTRPTSNKREVEHGAGPLLKHQRRDAGSMLG